jgi:hypothetical protein
MPTQCPKNYYNKKNMTYNYENSDHIKELMKSPPIGLQQCLEDPVLNTAENDYKISKGHLVASADFVSWPERATTFCFLNAAPQWEVTNSGNFANVEEYTRKIVHKAKKHLDVYTGTHGDAKVFCYLQACRNIH